MIEQLRSALRNVIQQEQGPIDTLAMYPGTVAVQHDDGTVDVVLDDQRFGPGLSGIPIRSGVPGVTAKLPQGTRVAVGFEEQKRDKPAVMMWESGLPSQIIIQTSAGSIKVEDNGSPENGPKITLNAGTVVVDAQSISLGKNAALGVARMGDTVIAGPFGGTITMGSTKVKAE